MKHVLTPPPRAAESQSGEQMKAKTVWALLGLSGLVGLGVMAWRYRDELLT
jgi:hypothetical protein